MKIVEKPNYSWSNNNCYLLVDNKDKSFFLAQVDNGHFGMSSYELWAGTYDEGIQNFRYGIQLYFSYCSSHLKEVIGKEQDWVLVSNGGGVAFGMANYMKYGKTGITRYMPVDELRLILTLAFFDQEDIDYVLDRAKECLLNPISYDLSHPSQEDEGGDGES